MRKDLLLVWIIVFMLLFGSVAVSCLKVSETENSETENSNWNVIDLTIDNYDYYLSIDMTTTSSGTVAGGTIHYYSQQVTINGAVYGLYQDCSLFYKVGDKEEKQVKLNAAGFAKFNYTSANGKYLHFVRAEGKIIQ